MNEIVERVARSICAAGGSDPDASAGWLLQPGRKLWENHVTEARAAIEAMREPTPGMIEAAYDLPRQELDRTTRLDEYIERYDWKQLAPRAFSAMIDAALVKEPTPVD